MADVVIRRGAYVKPLLHAAKYPHCAVNGVVLAKNQQHKEDKSLDLVDAIPLFHSSLTLAPMMEVALSMIDSYCQSKGLVIAGYYQANENISELGPTGLAYQVGDKIKDNYGDACILIVDNAKVFTDAERAYTIYTNTDNKWKKGDKGNDINGDFSKIASALIESRMYRELVDFDNHLDDISLDWRNTDIDAQISQCL